MEFFQTAYSDASNIFSMSDYALEKTPHVHEAYVDLYISSYVHFLEMFENRKTKNHSHPGRFAIEKASQYTMIRLADYDPKIKTKAHKKYKFEDRFKNKHPSEFDPNFDFQLDFPSDKNLICEDNLKDLGQDPEKEHVKLLMSAAEILSVRLVEAPVANGATNQTSNSPHSNVTATTSNFSIPSPPTLNRSTATTPPHSILFDMNVPSEYDQAMQDIANPSHKYRLCTNEVITFIEMLSPGRKRKYHSNVLVEAENKANKWWTNFNVEDTFKTYSKRPEIFDRLHHIFQQARSASRGPRETRILGLQIFYMKIQTRFFTRPDLRLSDDHRAAITGPKKISSIGLTYYLSQYQKLQIANGGTVDLTGGN